ncbi:MAG: hypothetical protein QM790_03530 [Nibricoccus sp.]
MSSTTTEIQPTQQRSSVFHKAANLGLILLVSAWLFWVLGLPLFKSASRAVRVGMAYVPLSLGTLAILAGIAALVGIRKFGRQKLLWKGLVCCLVPVVLLLIALPGFRRMKQIVDDKRSALVASDLNRMGHVLLPGGAQLDGAEVLPGEGIRINFSMPTWLRREIDFKEWKNNVQPTIRQSISRTPIAQLAQSGVRVELVFRDMKGEEFDRRIYEGK